MPAPRSPQLRQPLTTSVLKTGTPDRSTDLRKPESALFERYASGISTHVQGRFGFRISSQPSHTREAHSTSFVFYCTKLQCWPLVNNDNWSRDQVGWPFQARSRLLEAIVIYKFPVKCILSESWHQTKSYKGSLSQQ
jgi:hypothetical protein